MLTQEQSDTIYHLAIKQITQDWAEITSQCKTLYAFGLALVDDFFAGFRTSANSLEALQVW